MHSQSGGGGRESSLLSVCVYEEKVRLGTSVTSGVLRDSSEVGGLGAVRGGAEAGRWGGEDFEALNVLLGGDRNAVFKVDTSTGE